VGEAVEGFAKFGKHGNPFEKNSIELHEFREMFFYLQTSYPKDISQILHVQWMNDCIIVCPQDSCLSAG
jgi:hypothetical protein